jgi:hypothetical protein
MDRPASGYGLVDLFVIVAIIGLNIGLLFVAVQKVRAAENRTAYISNQK